MARRRLLIPPAVLLGACLAVLLGCKPKPSGDGGDAPGGPTPAPAVASSDHLLFAQLNAKALRDSSLFGDVKQAFTRAGGPAEWDKIDSASVSEIGAKLTEIDTVTICVTEARDEPKFVLIISANKPIDKAAAFKLGAKAKPDDRGFYKPGAASGLVHFPDDKTAVIVHPDLAQKYLDGYAKDRTAWPLNADLNKAASGNTLFAVVNLEKAPRDAFNDPGAKAFAPLLAARTVTLAANLKGKELSAALRATFPDATAAGKAKETAQGLLGQAAGAVEHLTGGKGGTELGKLLPAVKEARRALKDTKVEATGSDVTVTASYKADFDVAEVLTEAVNRIQLAAKRAVAQNNLKQIGLALHSYHDTHGWIPIHGTGPKGAALKNANEKPLLSWRVELLPYVEQQELYNQFKLDEPWDSENNKKLIEKMPKLYAPAAKPGKAGHTHTQMVVGPSAMPLPVARIPASFPDGTSNTIAVVEAAEPVIWTKPDDVMFPNKELPKDFRKKFGGQFPGGFNVLLWDGSVRFVADTVSDKTLSFALNPSDGEVLGKDW
jgi:prepilin-type processing-associated H-X9-DG protein